MTTSNVFDDLCLSILNPPSACTYINGKFKYIKEIDQRLKSKKSAEQNQHYFMAFVIITCVLVGGFLFGKVFDKIFKSVMDERIDDAVEQAISRYQNVSDMESIELGRG